MCTPLPPSIKDTLGIFIYLYIGNSTINAGAGGIVGIGATSPNAGSDLASLFECPVCFDYVLPPILQVRLFFYLYAYLLAIIYSNILFLVAQLLYKY